MTTDISNGWQPAARFLGAMAVLAPLLAACATTPHHHGRSIFSSKEFGVPASRRVTNDPNPPHGGGISMVGQPYVVHGQWYTPKANPVGYNETGVASWYGWDFHGRLTANGEIFSANAVTAGSPDLPLPCYARVTNIENGRSMLVRFNDRGPYMAGRVVDLSLSAPRRCSAMPMPAPPKVRVQYARPTRAAQWRRHAVSDGQHQRRQSSLVQTEQGDTRLASVDPDQIRLLMAAPQPRPFTAVPVEAGKPRPARNPEMKQVLASVNGLFSYSEAQTENADVNSAHAAVDAMAARTPDLSDWVATTDDDQRAIKLELGTFADPAKAPRHRHGVRRDRRRR